MTSMPISGGSVDLKEGLAVYLFPLISIVTLNIEFGGRVRVFSSLREFGRNISMEYP